MNVQDAHKAVLQRWIAQWPTLSGSIPYVFDNDVADESVPYARVRIVGVDVETHTMGGEGNRKYRHTATVEVELHTPGNAGSELSLQLLGFVRTIYQGKRFGVTGGGEEGVTTFETLDTSALRDAAGTRRLAANARRWPLVASTAFEFYEVR